MKTMTTSTIDREMTTPASIDNSPRKDNQEEKEAQDHDDERTNECPLFMSGLPSDFSSNTHLMALASLIDGDGETSENKRKQISTNLRTEMPLGKVGGGKVRAAVANGGRKQRRKAISSPYPVPEKTPKAKAATLGEAQLFLKMWKI